MARPWWALLVSAALVGCLDAASPPEPTSPTPSPTPPTLAFPNVGTFEPGDVNATLVTSRGEIGIVLYGMRSPLTVCNFLRYVRDDFYDATIFHRICNHVIQAGGYDPYLEQQKPTRDPIPNEANASRLRNHKGTLGMARTNDPDSATSHFYVNLRDNLYLDPGGFPGNAAGYAVFGNVTSGWKVVEEIAATRTLPETGPSCNRGRPIPTMQTTIQDVRVSS